ncbi:imidazole glycerol phosphate synthase subunit HisH [uncultured Roseivirga sp.]|uniref:imidazole glycerol phosphate synthase subunit HisH n=1 Tax=uncultured Roseivirga sp. TaxID=543088 RepID=UPI002582C695|nr:imidazole glycerol phosphate synthase subunit HisH [uncultured Roseivirga sp.]|tara:strand:+ start:18184 stop:18840 length:657 start_codon:yes stop_codon:yes gene_type:complete
MSSEKVTIIDYQLGNLFSVLQACETIGFNVQISSKKKDIENSAALILPGVGAFAEAMNHLKDLGLIDPIKQHVQNNKPLLGICLGQQLLFEESEEFGDTKGLGLVPGSIRKFRTSNTSSKMRVPHIGWNQIVTGAENTWENTPLSDIKEGSFMYFVHSYYVVPKSDDVICSITEYEGVSFCSSVHYNSIFSTQFHPEKSGDLGLSIYRNWGLQHKLIK